MAVFKGAGVAIVTPMNADQTVNYDKLEEIIEEQIAGGTDAIIIVGTTGEGSTLTMEEHSKCIKMAVEFARHRIPVVAGTGSNCTATAIQLTQEAEEHGADAALVVTPYYNKATQKGLIAHYSAIADSTKLPMILYNVPGRTGTNIAPETAAYLHKTKKNIVGVKDATANLAETSEMMRLCDGDLELYSGEDGLVVPILSVGGIGVISVVSNIAPRYVHEMVMSFLAGDIEKSRKMQLKELPLVDALFCEVNPIPVKTAMNLMGKEVGPLRLPLCEMEPANLERLKKAMKDFGLL
ncbi:MAG: 4-hydroxy-tetrahydrodipicolinate synthase [Lachnospiraceae bacterium]|uniref:4-hydroxy-tetrahydrodipicolinate synthase n=1 Tax=Candidatus Weimeria bifida TaxID=2599074 RepID=A0A6N7IXI1_9FIRM|nr:4-hydroxy-tetrahydrodipicolinate synthase [Candidatus Weimeria bifida]RRF94684.1 MAG: 4-hydroxy-tetrahydrodipicolinate synthase [Lachnospiraceae bacterium]